VARPNAVAPRVPAFENAYHSAVARTPPLEREAECSMLSKEFVLLIIISCAIAIPLSFLLMRNWLESYVYRTDLSAWIFITAGMSARLITLLIVGF
jgi:hypothetical protein